MLSTQIKTTTFLPLVILLTLLSTDVNAQELFDGTSTALAPIATTAPAPSITITDAPSSPPRATPPALDGYGSATGPANFTNYYFILIVVALVLIIFTYWLIVKRRQRRIARRMGNGEVVEVAARRQWTQGRRRNPGSRIEEGLDERGEAPPPYVPGQPPPSAFAHLNNCDRGQGEEIALHHLGGKPPEYQTYIDSANDLNLSRPSATYRLDRPYTVTAARGTSGADL